MTIEELGKKTKEKYPVYNYISDLELGKKVIQKYPVYQKLIDQTPAPIQDPNAIKVGEQTVVGGPAATAIKNTSEIYKNAPGEFIKEAGRNDQSVNANPVIKAAENALGATASGVNTLFAPITGVVKTASDALVNSKSIQDFTQNETVGKILDLFGHGSSKLDSWAQQHPEAARNLSNLLTVGGAAIGGETSLAKKPITTLKEIGNTSKVLATDALNTGGMAAEKAINAGDAVGRFTGVAPKTVGQQIDRSINAVNPELTGKKLLNAYKEIATKDRGFQTSSVFREQKLSPDEQIVALGTRLKDVLSSNDPLKNLKNIGKSFKKTEDRIAELFKSDPEVQYNADKGTLFSKLEDIKTNIPRGFKAIRDSKSVFDNVVNFGRELLNGAEDTSTGIRDARTAFDTQARIEYPFAFAKEGWIDLKTPAGRAIRDVRDAFNEHLYNTAPEGSEIKRLIGHEADLFRANENIAAKAIKMEGLNKVKKFALQHPDLVKAVGLSAALTLIGGAPAGVKAFSGD